VVAEVRDGARGQNEVHLRGHAHAVDIGETWVRVGRRDQARQLVAVNQATAEADQDAPGLEVGAGEEPGPLNDGGADDESGVDPESSGRADSHVRVWSAVNHT
jgi:hypothetical protein